MAFVGIDPSIIATGIVVLDDDASLIGTQMILSDSPSSNWIERTKTIKSVHRHFRACLRKFNETHALDIIVLEDYSYGSRYQNHQLGELGFGLRRFLQEYYEENIFIIPPKRLVKFITGNGNNNKERVSGIIHDVFGLEFDNLHLSDACSGALFGLAIAGISPSLFTKDQLKLAGEYAQR